MSNVSSIYSRDSIKFVALLGGKTLRLESLDKKTFLSVLGRIEIPLNKGDFAKIETFVLICFAKFDKKLELFLRDSRLLLEKMQNK